MGKIDTTSLMDLLEVDEMLDYIGQEKAAEYFGLVEEREEDE